MTGKARFINNIFFKKRFEEKRFRVRILIFSVLSALPIVNEGDGPGIFVNGSR